MSRSTVVASPVGALAAAGVAAGAALAAEGPATPSAQESGRYEDLLGLFSAWRAFQKARLVAGVPDYTAAAMAGQQRELAGYERRLMALDPGPLADPAAGRLPRGARRDERARVQ